MKKFSKMLALGMALSLAFGVTAFAADSPTVETAGLGKVTVSAEGLEPGQEITLQATSSQTPPSLESEDKALKEDIIKSLNVGSKSEVVVKEVIDVSVNFPIGEDGVTLTFKVDFDPSKKYAVLHYNKDKNGWERVESTLAEDGKSISAKFYSLSPVGFVEVTPVGDDQPDNDEPASQQPQQPAPQPEAPKSPKTGEVLPMAGIMALICLAGAAVCAGKVRYNKQ